MRRLFKRKMELEGVIAALTAARAEVDAETDGMLRRASGIGVKTVAIAIAEAAMPDRVAMQVILGTIHDWDLGPRRGGFLFK